MANSTPRRDQREPSLSTTVEKVGQLSAYVFRLYSDTTELRLDRGIIGKTPPPMILHSFLKFLLLFSISLSMVSEWALAWQSKVEVQLPMLGAGGERDRRVSGTRVRDEPESKQKECVELGGMV